MNMDNELKKIIDFFEFAEKKLNINISFHTKSCLRMIKENIGIIGKFNTHCSKLCVCVKSNEALRSRCIQQQSKVLANCRNAAFYGRAFCGAEEIILPIMHNGIVLGFISIGSFCSDRKKAIHTAHKNMAEYNPDLTKINAALKSMTAAEFGAQTAEMIFSRAADMLGKIMYRYYNSENTSLKENIYADIIAYINLNFTEKICVSDIAAHCFCSKSYINHLFKKVNGKSISEYINEKRLERAQELLKETNLSIAETARKSGFLESGYFSNVFKLHFGITPSEYRKNF